MQELLQYDAVIDARSEAEFAEDHLPGAVNWPSLNNDERIEVGTLCAIGTTVTGSIWAKPAWNTYWTWDPRLTTTLLSLLIYVAYLVLRVFGGDGPGERKFAAALGVLGAANLPIIHFSVEKWAGQHPKVIMAKGGGGLHPDMKVVFFLAMLTFTLLAVCFLWARVRVELARARLARAEEDAIDLGLDDRTEA